MSEVSPEIDYLTAKSIWEREVSKLPAFADGKLPIPPLLREQNETRLEFASPEIRKENLFSILTRIMHHIPYLRTHSADKNHLTIQALNENVFDTKNLIQNLKFRFLFSGNPKLEIQKQGNLKEREILALLEVFRFLMDKDSPKSQDPRGILNSLGTEVFDPAEAKLKNRWIDFSMIFGYESVKREILETVIMPFQNPRIFEEISKLTRVHPSSIRPRAILFEGEPGVGKTTMARAISCLCNTLMVYVPIESILSKYYGESAKNLALIFDACELLPGVILFLDEIDSLAGRREDGMFEATRSVLSVLLRKLDGFEGKPDTVTLGATNRKVDLDPALLSRFEKSIYFPPPNREDVSAILSGYARHLSHQERWEISGVLGSLSGRKIKDFCDYVERKWATLLVEKQAEISPPPASLYAEIAEFMKKR